MTSIDQTLQDKVDQLAELGIEVQLHEDMSEEQKTAALADLSAMIEDLSQVQEGEPASVETIAAFLTDAYGNAAKTTPEERTAQLNQLADQDAETFARAGLYQAFETFFLEDSLAMTVEPNEEAEELVRLLNHGLVAHKMPKISEIEETKLVNIVEEAESPDDYIDLLWPALFEILKPKGLSLLEMAPTGGFWSVHALIMAPTAAVEKWDGTVLGDYALFDFTDE